MESIRWQVNCSHLQTIDWFPLVRGLYERINCWLIRTIGLNWQAVNQNSGEHRTHRFLNDPTRFVETGSKHVWVELQFPLPFDNISRRFISELCWQRPLCELPVNPSHTLLFFCASNAHKNSIRLRNRSHKCELQINSFAHMHTHALTMRNERKNKRPANR